MQSHFLPPSPMPDDDRIDDLPPIDGDDGDPLEAPIETDELEGMLGDESGGSDDAIADDLMIGDLAEGFVEEAASAVDEPGEVDIGESELMFAEPAAWRTDDDVAGLAKDDLSLGIDAIPEQGEGDGSEEGSSEGAAEDIDEARLPELDSDDEGDLPGDVVVDETQVADEVPLPGWAASRWERVAIPLVAVPMQCLWVGAHRVLAAGEGAVALRFDNDSAPDAHWLPLEGMTSTEIVSVASDDREPARAVLATRSSIFVSADGGATVNRSGFRPPGESTIVGVTVCSRRWQSVYAHTSCGALLASLNACASWKRIDGLGLVKTVAQDAAGNVHVLTGSDDPAVMRLDLDGRWAATSLPAGAEAALLCGAPLLSVQQDLCVVGTSEGRIWTTDDAAGAWREVRLPSGSSAIVAIDTPGESFAVAVVFVESEDRSYLVRIGRDGLTEVVGDLSPDVAMPSAGDSDDSDGMGRALALAWDERRGWLWVAGQFGLQAWRPVFPA